MARFETFARDLQLATESISPDVINAELAKFAREELANAITAGEGSRTYLKYVNGRQGAAEESVRAPGPIFYEFAWWPVIVIAALGELQRLAPVRSGRYRSSFIVLSNRVPVADFDAIPPDAEVIITNVQPYTRKVQVGALNGVAPRLFDRARSGLVRKVGGNLVQCQVQFLDFPAGIHPLVPYILKYSARSRRRDRQAGQPITYPSLVMRMVD